MTRAVILAIVAALLLAVLTLLDARWAHAEQCGCPAPWEPPVVVQPLPPMVPGGGYVWMAYIAGGAKWTME